MFSTMIIEFLVDFAAGYSLKVSSKVGTSAVNSDEFDWLVTRSAAFEVTEGTPTGTAGETTATNFKTAYDLDNTIGATTSRVTNTLTFTSTTADEDFVGVRGFDDLGNALVEGVDFNITYNNVEPTIDTSNIDLALVRSPHYINIPFDFTTTTAATIDLYIWDGDLTVVPSTANYQLTLPRPSTDFADFNTSISEFIESEIEAQPNLSIGATPVIVDSSTESVKWVKYNVSYTDPDETIANITSTLSGVEGYGFYSEGVNPTKPANDWLTECFNRRVDRGGVVVIPFLNTSVISSITVQSETNQINTTLTPVSSNESTDFLQYVQFNTSLATSDRYVTISDGTNDIIIEIVDECRYEPKTVIFKNRFGAYESMTLFKKSANTLSVTKSQFTNQYLTNGTYDVTQHQMKDINIQAKESVRVNSGYVSEDENVLYRGAITSDQVWFYENDALVPVRINKNSIELKTRINDGLVNYEMSFNYAYNYIQSV